MGRKLRTCSKSTAPAKFVSTLGPSIRKQSYSLQRAQTRGAFRLANQWYVEIIWLVKCFCATMYVLQSLMYVFYVDDSRDQGKTAYSALGIPMAQWKQAFRQIGEFRTRLRQDRRIPFGLEFHATAFLGGRGGSIRHIHKWDRSNIFRDALGIAAALPGARLLNACDSTGKEMLLFERLLNRISTCARKAQGNAIVMCDEGKEHVYRRLARQLGKINYIPSRYGQWSDGSSKKNIPTEQIIEDLVFKQSKDCRFVQLVDFCAYALLRMECPIPSKTKYGLDVAFEVLKPICVTEAFRGDPRNLGIIRAT